jgi:hypothetical protein
MDHKSLVTPASASPLTYPLLLLLFPIPSPQRLLITLPLRPYRPAVRTNAHKPSTAFLNLPFRLLTERTPARLRDPAPIFVLAILIADRPNTGSILTWKRIEKGSEASGLRRPAFTQKPRIDRGITDPDRARDLSGRHVIESDKLPEGLNQLIHFFQFFF